MQVLAISQHWLNSMFILIYRDMSRHRNFISCLSMLLSRRVKQTSKHMIEFRCQVEFISIITRRRSPVFRPDPWVNVDIDCTLFLLPKSLLTKFLVSVHRQWVSTLTKWWRVQRINAIALLSLTSEVYLYDYEYQTNSEQPVCWHQFILSVVT